VNSYFVTPYEENLFTTRYQDPGNRDGEQTWEDAFGRVVEAVVPDPILKMTLLGMMSRGEVLPSSPQLWNFGAIGRRYPMNGGSCFTGFMGDTLEDFRAADQHAESVYVASGGFGLLLDTVRPRGCMIKHCSEGAMGSMCSGGPAKRVEGTTGYITGSGRARGALMFQQSIWHPDILEFMLAKRPSSLGFMDDWEANARSVLLAKRMDNLDTLIAKYHRYAMQKDWPDSFTVIVDTGPIAVKEAMAAGIIRLNELGQLIPVVTDWSAAIPREANRDWDLPMQNCNMSVRVPDEFYDAIDADANWVLHWFSPDPPKDDENPWTKTDCLGDGLREIADGTVIIVSDDMTRADPVYVSDNSEIDYKYGVVITTWEGLVQNLSPNRNQWRDTEYSRFYRTKILPTLQNLKGPIKARQLWDILIDNAWNHADPGIINCGTYERYQPVDSTVYGPRLSNPCCLVGETLVDTDEGRIRIDELVRRADRGEALPNAFCYDLLDRRPSVRPITHAWLSGHDEEVFEVVTDKGIAFRGTAHHPVLLKNGSYVKICDLAPGMALRKIHRCVHPSGYVYITGRKDFIEHRLVYSEISETPQDQMEGLDVHHDDEDNQNNAFWNLKLVDSTEHRSQHSSGSGNPRFKHVGTKVLAEFYTEVVNSKSARGRPRKRPVTPQSWNLHVIRTGRTDIPKSSSYGIQGMGWNDFCSMIESHLTDLVDGENHKVVSIRYVGLSDVYNITVKDHHNFGISSFTDRTSDSIIVKNSEYVNSPGGSCNLISVNLRAAAEAGGDFLHVVSEFAKVASRYIIGAMDYSRAPVGFIDEMTRKHFRTVGVGFMGLAEALIHSGLRYGSEEAQQFTAAAMSEIALTAWETSFEMANEGLPKPLGWNPKRMISIFGDRYLNAIGYDLPQSHLLRWRRLAIRTAAGEWATNTVMTSVAPTGTIAQIAGFMMSRAAGCSISVTSGVEPVFAPITGRQDNSGSTTTSHDLWSTEVGTDILITAASASAEDHVRMQAAACAFCCMSVSKTINVPVTASREEIANAYRLAYELGVPGTSVYRDQSKPHQVLSALECPSGECKVGLDDDVSTMDRPAAFQEALGLIGK
jgi:ribonucleotide reductase alpha subunit